MELLGLGIGSIMDRSTHETSPGPGVASGARARLAALGLTLHGPHLPHPPLLAVVMHNGVAYVSGQLPRIDGKITCLGRLGESVSLEQGDRSGWSLRAQCPRSGRSRARQP